MMKVANPSPNFRQSYERLESFAVVGRFRPKHAFLDQHPVVLCRNHGMAQLAATKISIDSG
jgi:hypothetical protein